MLALCEALDLKVEGGFIDSEGAFVLRCPGMRAKMGARITQGGRETVVRENQWVVPGEKGVAVMDKARYEAKFGKAQEPAKELKPIRLDDSIPRKIIARAVLPPLKLDEGHYYRPRSGRSFGDVMASVEEGLREAKRELGIE